ncbi:protein kinase [Aspergillus karnatakaensis]|uniref:protein kinase n=1 Tax=Aspergillus karnatakaensis TaxID=1810916 RepID=UPI003CCCE51F
MFRWNLRRLHSPSKRSVPGCVISYSSRPAARTLVSSHRDPPRPSLGYRPSLWYYPVHPGDVFHSRYQVVSKLGYGTSSTVWLCRDSKENCYSTLKVCVTGESPDRERTLSEHLKQSSDVYRKRLVRLVLDSFEIVGPHGKHLCLFSKDLVQRSTQLTLITLTLLHENSVVHTDISPNNVLQGIEDTSILSDMEQDEATRPIARKVLADRTIYHSRPMPLCTGSPVLSDLGEARSGSSKYNGDIMPGIYRAPEVILEMEWDQKVDIWSVGNMVWDLVQGHHLFFAKQNGYLNDEHHLAEMVSLMGPPSLEFLKRSKKCERFWDRDGYRKGCTCIPQQSFEDRELQFSGQHRTLFLDFVRRIFRWLPEERPTAEELVYDAFLMQLIVAAKG